VYVFIAGAETFEIARMCVGDRRKTPPELPE